MRLASRSARIKGVHLHAPKPLTFNVILLLISFQLWYLIWAHGEYSKKVK